MYITAVNDKEVMKWKNRAKKGMWEGLKGVNGREKLCVIILLSQKQENFYKLHSFPYQMLKHHNFKLLVPVGSMEVTSVTWCSNVLVEFHFLSSSRKEKTWILRGC